ncbi:MAG: PilZ domain-containing protein [Vulcanimicrobiaceae bacterium]
MSERAFVERQHPRADVSLSATYQWAHAGERRTGWVVNIGVGGLRCVGENDDEGADGAHVLVALPLPRVGREMLLRGKVVALARSDDGTCGFSVAFQQMDAGDREAIGFLVETNGLHG